MAGKIKSFGGYPSLSEWMRWELPSFCWQSPVEVLTVLDLIDPSISQYLTLNSVSVRLHYLWGKGYLDRKWLYFQKRRPNSTLQNYGLYGYAYRRKTVAERAAA
jgi:hypothetical protein